MPFLGSGNPETPTGHWDCMEIFHVKKGSRKTVFPVFLLPFSKAQGFFLRFAP